MELSIENILSRCSVDGNIAQYERAIQRWLENPQYVNRRISTTVHLLTTEVQLPQNSHELLRIIKQLDLSSAMDVTHLINSLKNSGVLLNEINSTNYKEHKIIMMVKKLLPRYNKIFKEMLQIIIIDLDYKEFIFFGLPHEKDIIGSPLSPVHPFSLKFMDNEMLLVNFEPNTSSDKSTMWLKNTLFPKLLRWSEETQLQSSTKLQSLSLISSEKYTLLYQTLKEKYGQKLVEIWPERTDPQKFVYEDVAIATYLLLLWETQRLRVKRPDWQQSFVDMGCGNGLLVYILSSEGHPGIGVDVRKRGIWDLYPTTTHLKEQTFIPSDCNIFPEADWIIGNHSDELTPWIPVIASKSSYNCNFFLLPCCAYEFSGKKYQRVDSSRSQYSEYLDYVKNICEKCGFQTNFDRLKIPSTKRICLVSFGREYSENNFEEKQEEIMEYIKKYSQTKDSSQEVCPNGKRPLVDESDLPDWNPHFIAREPKEKVRNCTQLQKGINDDIVKIVVKLLLAEKHCISILDNEGIEKFWNAGQCIKLAEIAASLPQKLLIELKKECGGLQTLLRNNHEIFCVSNGTVKLALPTTINEKITARSKTARRKREIKVKQKPCWFFNFHPNGCPLKEEECTFCH